MNAIKLLHEPVSWLLGKPSSSAQFRALPEDFQVTEILGFEPEGYGEHLFLYVRKIGENTDWVAQQIARYTGTHPKDIGYAGKKDRHAVTEQWFSVKLPIKQAVDWSSFNTESMQVIHQVRHQRKLKTGVHQGNRFTIRLRQVTDEVSLKSRFDALLDQGVPNYFGEQRFGHHYGNLFRGIQLVSSDYKEKSRQKRGLYISALRSMLFNRVISARISQGIWGKLVLGDVLMLNNSQSCFKFDESTELATLNTRLASKDIHLTAPLWGRGELMSSQKAQEFEKTVLAPWVDLCQGLASLGLNQERRAARIALSQASLHQEKANQWIVSFDLPAGAFATSVLRELSQLHTEDAEKKRPEREDENFSLQ